MSLCGRDMRQLLCNWFMMNMIFIKRAWNFVKKKDSISGVSSCKFCEFLNNNGFWVFLRIILQIFGWLLLDFLLLNRFFANVIKIINLTILKLTRISFFNEVAFYFAWLLHCIKSVRISLSPVWMRENADQNNSEYGHFLRSVVL